MRLYQNTASGCSRRVLLAIHELGLADEVDLVTVDLARGAQKAPDYLALNPNGKVPVLDDHGFVLWESNAIMQYLADGTSGQKLYPTERKLRADVSRWMFWHTTHFAAGISVLNRERVVKKLIGQGEPDPVEVARGEGLIRQFGAVLDAQLAGKTWMLGDTLTLADLAIAADLAATEKAQLPLGDFKNVTAWFERVRSRASWSYGTA